MKIFKYLLLLLLVALNETILRDITDVMGVAVNIPAMMVVAVAMRESELEAIWWGLIVGVVMSALTPNIMGWHALALSGIALGAYHAKDRVNMDSPLARLSLIIAGVLLHNILTILISQPVDIVYQMWRYALTGTLYSAVIASMYFIVKRSVVTTKRIRTT